MNTIYTMSTLSTSSIEDVAKASPDTNKFFQLYIYKDRELTKNLVRRAEKAGYKALVLTGNNTSESLDKTSTFHSKLNIL